MVFVKRVAIIGAGVSGLVSVKSCLEEEFQPICFEKSSQIGGVWIYSENGTRGEASAMYNGLVTNSSKEMMCFSDFAFPAEHPPYLSTHHVIKYYRDYAEHYDIMKYVKFNTEVVDVSPTENNKTTGQWNVTVRQRNQEQLVEQTDVFDAVMVCTGKHSKCRIPEYPRMDKFKGQIIHSNTFRRGEDFVGQNVLVVGASHSAGDLATQCSQHTNSTYISLRNGCYVLPRRGPNGIPIDTVANRRFSCKIPGFIRSKMLTSLVESRMDLDNLSLRSDKKNFFSSSMMVNDLLPDRILNGTLKVKAHIERFTKNGVKFVDGTYIEDIDTIVFATGYYTSFPFISREIFDETKMELFKHILSPKYTTLAFIGAVGAVGSQGPVYELQARWTVSVFSGTLKLPDVNARQIHAKKRVDKMIKLYGYLKIKFAPVPYQEELANDIGVKPTLDMFLTDPKLAVKVFFGPAYPPSYRLKGPHTWAGARDAIMKGWENTTSPTRTRQITNQHDVTAHLIFIAMFLFSLILAIFFRN
ncbi:dimethylaniline monooxygenase [N-oxide-forming] 5-like [Anneissia japonica]|uniref:dimethylaniline monooxygenase [N-oxide-forming] 5-like n=1 Tax=Anneissia japonica TaxID=1529436 RepID=UPI001425A6B7|nr:dimethylaniline monooxygenase [N-oxide-forming] 5-like [Anneissia japonica]XP_033099831.1 dimethylaniline monooxygenase [N-oxide-forming] 5-like [Anneissia japonica]XP_033099832.1 dimethylaniline monooxygenase [N-oxide-forming] 5-like [Anneissia japonica]XP_033099833.1 dimethylaniline monooxygenase [N-oxide-forming] 5-like [Anneissia japonica]